MSELVLAQAQTYAYDKLDQQLMTPFLLANQAEVFSFRDLIDGSFVEGQHSISRQVTTNLRYIPVAISLEFSAVELAMICSALQIGRSRFG